MKKNRGRILSASVLVVAAIVGGGSAAWATNTGWKATTKCNNNPCLSSSTAKFSGAYIFYDRNEHNGQFGLKGTLYDLNKSNGRKVKMGVRPMGYSATWFAAETDKDRSIPERYYGPGDQVLTTDASIKVCQQNRLTDDCSDWQHYRTPY